MIHIFFSSNHSAHFTRCLRTATFFRSLCCSAHKVEVTKAEQDTASEALSSDKVKRRFLKTLSKIDLFIIKMVDDLDEKKNADHCNFENNQTYFF